MLSVAEALAQILHEARVAAPVERPLKDSLLHVLAAEVRSDSDSPPFDKALMDGYAVIAADLRPGGTRLEVIEEVTAGVVPQRLVESGKATRIMTGAPLPEGADAVIKVEETEIDGDPREVRILADSALPGQNLIRRGTNKRAGEIVVEAGTLLRAPELAALAEMGCHEVRIFPQPRVAVLATGDELVPIHSQPQPGQIRNSNETMLCAQIRQVGAIPVPLGIARDERSELAARIDAGLAADVLLLSGGVSAGVLDLVPSELQRAGVEQVFHKVNVKPGKPLWFGVLHQDERSKLVFGLPGNPVSSMVCFELFVRPALRRLLGVSSDEPRTLTARLTHSHSHSDDRPTYFPAAIDQTDDGLSVSLMNWHGSSDLQSTVGANGMVAFPPEPVEYAAGDPVSVIRWSSESS
ncbi:molybdopterin molybdenumtransferase MoeA [bacterium]|nr:molybdopterin molybdenumtransferase MoeA [bacterium]